MCKALEGIDSSSHYYILEDVINEYDKVTIRYQTDTNSSWNIHIWAISIMHDISNFHSVTDPKSYIYQI